MTGDKAIIIGGGIHGLTVAIALAEDKINVTLLEKKTGLFKGTSGSTHNRAHMGYHYPRSIETAYECLNGLAYFKKRYPEALFFPNEGYYIIAKDSRTSKEEYAHFCKKLGIPSIIKWSSAKFLLRDSISAPFLSLEPIFNTGLLCKLLEKEALEKGVNIKTMAEVVKANRLSNGVYSVVTKERKNEISYMADIVVNATYAYTNNILKIFELEKYMMKYRLQTTEVAVVKTHQPIPPLTIMDGPYMSIMPYVGHRNHFLVYDVTNSVVNEKESFLYDDSGIFQSNWERMVEKGAKYFPFMRKLEYAYSLWGARPIPLNTKEQSRQTRLKSYNASPGFYSLLEGKFISAPLMAYELKQLIQEDGLIKCGLKLG